MRENSTKTRSSKIARKPKLFTPIQKIEKMSKLFTPIQKILENSKCSTFCLGVDDVTDDFINFQPRLCIADSFIYAFYWSANICF